MNNQYIVHHISSQIIIWKTSNFETLTKEIISILLICVEENRLCFIETY